MSVYMKTKSGDVIETDNPEFWTEADRIPAAEGKRVLQAEARTDLRALFPVGATVYTVLRHVSASGMSRRISVLAIDSGRIRDVSALVARACDMRRNKRDGALVVPGCGMDMGFHVVDCMSWAVHNKGAVLRHEWV